MRILEKSEYGKVLQALKKVRDNTLFARLIVEGKLKGMIYVNDSDCPSTFYIVHSIVCRCFLVKQAMRDSTKVFVNML